MMHNQHVMIDIETLSTESDAAIIAIGVLEFDLETILEQKMWLINPMFAQGRRDDSTLTWWSDQDPGTQARVWAGQDRETVVFLEFSKFLEPFSNDHWIWAGPATFDLAILKNRYRDAQLPYPINWRNERDLSTLSHLAHDLGIDYSGELFDGFEIHNPLSDCIKQARRTQIILNRLTSMTWGAA